MSQIVKKFVQNNAIGAAKIRLENNQSLKARNAADSADVNILNLDGSNITNLTNGGSCFIYIEQTSGYIGILADDVCEIYSNHVDLWSAGAGAPGLRFYDDDDSNWIELKAAGTIAADFTLRLPSADGGAGTLLKTDASGGLSFSTEAALKNSAAVQSYWGAAALPSLVFDGSTADALTAYGCGVIYDGDDTQGALLVATKQLSNTAKTADLQVLTGKQLGTAGNSGNIYLASGDSANGNSGYVTLYVGAAPNGTMGRITLDANGSKIELKDGSLSGASVGHVLSLVNTTTGEVAWAAPSGGTPKKETFTLSAGDITNQYLDLTQVAKTDSIHFVVKGGAPTVEGASHDYSVNYTGGVAGKTRITFLNDLATGGGAALVAGDVVQIVYIY